MVWKLKLREVLLATAIFGVVIGIAIPIVLQQISKQRENEISAREHELAIALFSYANDHQQTYPFAKTSTKVFQTLFDEHYLADPKSVYFDMPGKRPASDKTPITLSAENVCYDLVGHSDGGLDDEDTRLPMILPTGFGPYVFKDGPNPIQIGKSRWIESVSFDQQAEFLRANADGFVNLTGADYKAPPKRLILISP